MVFTLPWKMKSLMKRDKFPDTHQCSSESEKVARKLNLDIQQNLNDATHAVSRVRFSPCLSCMLRDGHYLWLGWGPKRKWWGNQKTGHDCGGVK